MEPDNEPVPNCIGVENTINSTFNQIKCPNACNYCIEEDEMRDLDAIKPMKIPE
jgi:hypothetical protein